MEQLLVSGNGIDILGLPEWDSKIPEGATGHLDIDFKLPVNHLPVFDGVFQEIARAANAKGGKVTFEPVGDSTARFNFRKGAGPLAIIVAAIVLVGFLIILMISFRVFIENPASGGGVLFIILTLAAIGLVAFGVSRVKT